MANVCGQCKRPMSSHDDHASCPLCRITAGECHVDVDNPCSICGILTSKQWNSTATTAPSTAPLPLTAGPSTIEPIVPIVAPLGARDTPSVIQRTRPVVSTEQTMQSTAVYGPLSYCRIRHPLPYCRIWHPAVSCYVSKPFLPNGLLWSGQSVTSYA